MAQPPVPGPGQGDQPGRDPGLPGGTPQTPGTSRPATPDTPRTPGTSRAPRAPRASRARGPRRAPRTAPTFRTPRSRPGLPLAGPGRAGGARRAPGSGGAARSGGGPDGGVALPPPPGRDPRLAAFAQGEVMDRVPASAWLAIVLEEVSGPQRRCAGASDDELTGILGRWAALEAWAAAGKLAVTAELVRRRAVPGHGPKAAGGMPSQWELGTGHEVAAALAVSLRSADDLAGLSVVLQGRLPRIGALLAAGVISELKAKIVAGELAVLGDEAAACAEALVVAGLAGRTPGQVGALAAAAVDMVDPQGAVRRREQAEREQARVRFWRERAGTAAMAAYGLPADAGLAANAVIRARALAYKKAGVSPGAGMDQLRVLAFLDLVNGITAAARIALARAEQHQNQNREQGPAGRPGGADTTTSRGGRPGGTGTGQVDPPAMDDHPHPEPAGDPVGDDILPGNDDFPGDDDLPGIDDLSGVDDRCGDGDQRGGQYHPGSPQTTTTPDAGDDIGPALAASTNLTLPLATLQGLAQRPGHGHGLGPLDPALVRDLAAAAARSPHSTFCLTITDPSGIAIGHGCARPTRGKRAHGKPASNSRDGPWRLTRRDDDPGPPGGYGTWSLTLPGGRQHTVKLHPIPVTSCDHRYQTRAYQPGDLLRHLVQIRDGQCTFPSCSRHARESDFEHAVPYDRGGMTCACNGGARSRRCHKVKQSKGWTVTQPRPGWHQWRAPSGRTYTQGPMRYPA